MRRITRSQCLLALLCPLILTSLLTSGDGRTSEAGAATLAIGLSVNDPPLAFVDGGVIRGLEVDLARKLADALERDLRLRRLPEPRELEALRGGRVDIIFSRLPSRELQALGLGVSAAILRLGQMAMVRTDELERFPRLIDLKLTEARVGYERGTLGARWVQSQLPRAERVPLDSAETGLDALSRGDIDIFIHDATTAWRLASNPEHPGLSGIYRGLTNESLRLVTRSEDESLRRACDRVIETWRGSGELEELIRRWIPLQIRISGREDPGRSLSRRRPVQGSGRQATANASVPLRVARASGIARAPHRAPHRLLPNDRPYPRT